MQPSSKRRTTTGCLTCRARRKKCNEEKPTCTGCRRNFLICSWEDRERMSKAVLLRPTEQKWTTSADIAAKCGIFRPVLPVTGELRVFSTCHTLYPIDFMPGPRRNMDGHLFDHYLQVTSAQLAGRVEPQNPFLTHLIPVACSNPTVFQCILALSGAQLRTKSDQYEYSARSHYAVALRGVKHNLLEWQKADTVSLIALLTTTILLGFFEVRDVWPFIRRLRCTEFLTADWRLSLQAVIGDVNGSFHYHLRASRTLLFKLRDNRLHEADRPTLDLLTEIYASFAITTNLTLHADLFPNRDIPQDHFLSSESLSSLNKNNDIYGTLLGSAHELYALINPIARSARYFLSHPGHGTRTAQLVQYESEILSWMYQPLGCIHSRSTSPPDSVDPYELGGRIYQQALLIFLYTMFHGAQAPDLSLIGKVDIHVKHAFSLLGALPHDAFIQTTLMWPLLIAGSCLRDPVTRAGVLAALERVPYTTMSVARGFEFLRLLWMEMDGDECVFGPYGIELTMVKHRFGLCCA